MAEELGVDRKTVGRWERGEAAPSAAQLAGMTTMGVDIRYVLTGQREGAGSVNEVAHPYPVTDPLCEQVKRLPTRQRKAIADLVASILSVDDETNT
jgi:transcriptional regulator with XRE-family HTH domain